MKKKILLVISIILALGLGVAAVAYQRATLNTQTTASCCCCSGDSCPMKANAATGDHESCCGDDCCCKDGGESCPMKKGSNAAMTAHSADKKEGCCSCCKKDKQA